MRKNKKIALTKMQALQLQSLIQTCQRIIEGRHDLKYNFSQDLLDVERILVSLGKSKLPAELIPTNTEAKNE